MPTTCQVTGQHLILGHYCVDCGRRFTQARTVVKTRPDTIILQRISATQVVKITKPITPEHATALLAELREANDDVEFYTITV